MLPKDSDNRKIVEGEGMVVLEVFSSRSPESRWFLVPGCNDAKCFSQREERA